VDVIIYKGKNIEDNEPPPEITSSMSGEKRKFIKLKDYFREIK
jgi:hypothetical protein